MVLMTIDAKRLSHCYLGSSPCGRNCIVSLHLLKKCACTLLGHRGANPDFVSNELLYQIQVCNAKLILVHLDALETAVTAARSAGITLDRVIVFDVDSKNAPKGFQTVSNLVWEGLNQPSNFVESRIDARTKLAFLSFSSGML